MTQELTERLSYETLHRDYHLQATERSFQRKPALGTP